MNGEQITAFLKEYEEIVTLVVGVVAMIGSIQNWDWMCDPTGAPYSQHYGRGARRVIFFLLGLVLVLVSIM